MPSGVDLVWNVAEYEHLMTGPDGGVARMLEALGIDIEREAKTAASGRPGPMVITGRLRDSITHVVFHDGSGLALDVGTNVEYGKYLETGTVNMPAYPWLKPGFDRAWASFPGFG